MLASVALVLAAMVCRRALARSPSVTATMSATWGEILIIGDEPEPCRGRHPVKIAELYDPLANRFAARPPTMRRGRTGAAASILMTGRNAGRVLIAGGFDGEPLYSTELYDPARDQFMSGPKMSTQRNYDTATVVAFGPKAGSILIAGFDESELYDPITSRLTIGPRMIKGRIRHTATVITVGPSMGKVLFAGGLDFELKNQTELYDPGVDEFVPGPAMNVGRWNHTATVITTGANTGKILLVGGWGASGKNEAVPLASTEIYDPASDTFAAVSNTPTLRTARAWHTATVIPSGLSAGNILIVGGQPDDHTTFSSTELYDPLTNRFVPGPNLHQPRTQHVAMVIGSGPQQGKILIAGGIVNDRSNPVECDDDCNFTPLSTTEFYNPTTNSFEPGPRMHGAPGEVIGVQLPPPPSTRKRPGHYSSFTQSDHVQRWDVAEIEHSFLASFPCEYSFFGIDAPPDYGKAFACFRKAGKPSPFIALMYFNGDGTPRSLEKAEAAVKARNDLDEFDDDQAATLQAAIDACRRTGQKSCRRIDFCKQLATYLHAFEVELCDAVGQVRAEDKFSQKLADLRNTLNLSDRTLFDRAVAEFKVYALREMWRGDAAHADRQKYELAGSRQASFVRDNFLKFISLTIERHDLESAEAAHWRVADDEVHKIYRANIRSTTAPWRHYLHDRRTPDFHDDVLSYIANYDEYARESQLQWIKFRDSYAQLANSLYWDNAKVRDPALSAKMAVTQLRIAELGYDPLLRRADTN